MVRTRFAPSPTGYLHIGGLRTALYAYLYAKKNGGKFVLRIEDTDTERFVEGATEIIYSTLKNSGLVYDEGPDVGGEYAPYIQSERKNTYMQYAEQLVKNGGAYYCFCTKERLAELHEGGATKYDKHCMALSDDEVKAKIEAGESYVIRQNIPTSGSSTYTDMVFGDITVENKDLEDGILIKSDGMPTYNFANVVDDYLMGINFVIRGTEYLSSTPKYNYMYDGLGWQKPNYMHLQPIMRDATHKLSKRYGDASYDDFIKRGYLSEAVVNYIALLGWSPKDNREKLTLDEMIELFSVDGLSKSSSIFDEDKMRWLNSLYVRELDADKFFTLASPFMELDYLKNYNKKFLATLLQPRCELLSDVEKLTAFLTEYDNFNLDLFTNVKWKTNAELAKKMIPELLAELGGNFENCYEALQNTATKYGYKKGQVLWIFRIAITGALSTPGGATEMAELLGEQETFKRLNETLNRI